MFELEISTFRWNILMIEYPEFIYLFFMFHYTIYLIFPENFFYLYNNFISFCLLFLFLLFSENGYDLSGLRIADVIRLRWQEQNRSQEWTTESSYRNSQATKSRDTSENQRIV